MSASRTVQIFGALALSVIASTAAQAGIITTADGSVTVTDVVTPISGSLFQYDYTIADGTGLLAVVDIAVTPGISISGLATPGGSDFTGTIDTVSTPHGPEEFVSFLENNGTFTAAPESGFIFDSPVAPSLSTFDVTLFDGTTGSGGIQAPVATPEPGSLALCALGAVALLFWRKRWPASRLGKVS